MSETAKSKTLAIVAIIGAMVAIGGFVAACAQNGASADTGQLKACQTAVRAAQQGLSVAADVTGMSGEMITKVGGAIPDIQAGNVSTMTGLTILIEQLNRRLSDDNNRFNQVMAPYPSSRDKCLGG